MKEPLIHSHLQDCLPLTHCLCHEDIFCDMCNVMIHAHNNECMQTWLETSSGNFCTKCFPITDLIQNIPLKNKKGLKSQCKKY